MLEEKLELVQEDLYDRTDVIPFDKIKAFYDRNI